MATILGSSGNNSLTGTDDPSDTILGLGGSDTINANGGNDVIIVGNGGNDTIDGGTGDDQLIIDSPYADATFSFNGSQLVITVGVTTETVSNVETVVFTDKVVRVVGAGSEYATIQSAIDAASDGDVIYVVAGSYTEDLVINGKEISLVGAGAGLTTLQGQITVNGVLDGAASIEDMSIDATGKSYGVFVSASSTAFEGAVTLDGVAISNAGQNGFAYIRDGNGGAPTLADTIGSISILNSTFSGTAPTNTGSGGRGDIMFFGYNQDVTISDVTISGAGAQAQKAIQLRGIQDPGDVAGTGPYDPAGDVAITNLNVTGTYLQDMIAVYRVASFDSFAFSGTTLNGSAAWGLVNLDSVGGTIDLSTGLTATNSHPSGLVAHMQGLSSADDFTGTAGSDILRGRAGADSMNGGDGSDLYIVDNTGDTVAESAGQGTTDTVQASASFTLAAGSEVEALQSTGSGINLTGNEFAQSITGDAGNNDLTGGGGNDTIDGGAGVDTVQMAGNVDDYDVSFGMGGELIFTHQTSGEVTTISNAEGLDFETGADVVIGGGTAGSSFATIQAAIDAAEEGNIVFFGPGTFTEDLVINAKGITLSGFEKTGPEASVLNGKITVSGLLDSAAKVQNVSIDATGKDYGVFVSANSTAFAGSFALEDVAIANANQNGFAYIRAGNGGAPTLTDTLGNISVVSSEFTNNGILNTGSGGRGDIMLFGYNQDATFEDVTITGPAGTLPEAPTAIPANAPQKAIQIRGLQDGADLAGVGPYQAGGDVAFTNVTITGNYAHEMLAVYRFAGFDSFAFTNTSMTGNAGFGTVNFDSVGGVVDLSSGLTLSNSFTTRPGGYPGAESTLQGLSSDDTLTGTAFADLLNGRLGNDTMAGGDGDDRYVVSDAGDVITEASGQGSDSALATVSYTLGAGASVEALTSLGTGLNLTGNELAQAITGDTGNNVLTGGGGNDTISGGAGIDTIEMAGSNEDYDVSFGGGGELILTHTVTGDVTTITGAERIGFATGPDVVLSAGVAGSAYTTIQAGVEAANDTDIVFVGAGTYTENVTITGKAIELAGAGSGDTTINGQITVDGELNGSATISDMSINATANSYGIFVSASSVGFAGALTVRGVDIVGGGENAFAYIRTGNSTTPTLTDTLGSITLEDMNVSGFAPTNTGSGGRGGILFFGYNQDLTVNNVDISSPGAQARKAFALRGLQDGGDVAGQGPYDQGGDVSINGLTVSGTYLTDMFAVYAYAGFDSFAFTNTTLNGSAPWGIMNFDGVGGTIDLSTGVTATNGIGTSPVGVLQGLNGAQTFIGTAGNDVFVGRAGADSLTGGDGNDNYFVTDGSNVIVETAGQGSDVVSAFASYTLGAGVSVETMTSFGSGLSLTGNALAQTINGDAGNNIIVGGGGADTLDGNGGNDAYTADSDDTILEGAGEGDDTINVSASYAIAVGVAVEHLISTGAGLMLTGNELAQSIVGDSGNNTLAGGGGGDTLTGGLGNDIYNVDGTETLVEASGEGTDTVNVGTTYILAAGVSAEVINSTGSGIALTGNELGQTINGDSGANLLTGGGGIDTLVGGLGNDTYNYTGTETITETAGSGTDTVITTSNFTLLNTQSIENIVSAGMGLTLIDNSSANTITGDAGANLINGGGANDTIIGGAGADTVVGGTGNDSFRYTAGSQLVTGEQIHGGNQDGSGGVGETNTVAFASGASGGSLDLRLASNITNINQIDFVDAADVGFTSTITLFSSQMGTSKIAVDTFISPSGGNDALFVRLGTVTGIDLSQLDFGGWSANDRVYMVGNNAVNTLVGSEVRDNITAGGGADIITGGLGSDIFVYNSVTDSGATAPTADTVTDFSTSVGNRDRFDLTGIDANVNIVGDQAFTFIGAGSFTNTAGELRYQAVSATDLIIQADINGDSVTDFAINITGHTVANANWFSL